MKKVLAAISLSVLVSCGGGGGSGQTSSGATYSGPAPGTGDAILHAFNWDYSEVADNAEKIAAQGFGAVLVSPPLKSTGSEWWARYQPQDYRVIDNPLGDKTDFVQMVNALKAAGVETYADAIINHMANTPEYQADLNYPGSSLLQQYAADPDTFEAKRLFGDLTQALFTAADFNPKGCISNYNSASDVQTYRLCSGGSDQGLPDLAYTDHVVGQQQAYINGLKALGVTGFRVDAAKHMTLDHINQIFDESTRQGAFVFGELITGGSAGQEYQVFLQPWIAQTPLAAYDFPLFHRVRSAFSFGQKMDLLTDPETAGEALAKEKSVVFPVTHDIPLNGIFRSQLMDAVDEQLAYAYYFARGAGRPLVYSDHGEGLDQSDNARWSGMWQQSWLTAMNAFRNHTADQAASVVKANSCSFVLHRGNKGIAAINKCSEDQSITIDLSSVAEIAGDYQELITGEFSSQSDDQIELTLPGRSARLCLKQ